MSMVVGDPPPRPAPAPSSAVHGLVSCPYVGLVALYRDPVVCVVAPPPVAVAVAVVGGWRVNFIVGSVVACGAAPGDGGLGARGGEYRRVIDDTMLGE